MIGNIKVENLRGGHRQNVVEGTGTVWQRRGNERCQHGVDPRQVTQRRIENGAHKAAIGLAQCHIGGITPRRVEHTVQRRLAINHRRQKLGRSHARLKTGLRGRGLLLGLPLLRLL